MSEGFKAPESGPKESFSNKKDSVVAYLEAKIKQAKATLEKHGELNGDRKTGESIGPIPDEVLKDGGSDLSEWRAQIGADAHDREHDDQEDGGHVETLSRNVSDLEQDLAYIQTIRSEEEAGQDDVRTFERYLTEVAKSKA